MKVRHQRRQCDPREFDPLAQVIANCRAQLRHEPRDRHVRAVVRQTLRLLDSGRESSHVYAGTRQSLAYLRQRYQIVPRDQQTFGSVRQSAADVIYKFSS